MRRIMKTKGVAVEKEVPYLPSVQNLHKILDKIQNAGVPESFNVDFLKDLGFPSSNDRGTPKLLKYLGMLDAGNRPTASYREFTDHTKSKGVLAGRLRGAYDDLYLSDKAAHTKSVEQLKGWFKSKTGAGDAVAQKMATTFKSLASYADFNGQQPPAPAQAEERAPEPADVHPPAEKRKTDLSPGLGLVYRIEIHLPDTQNIETFRAIFKALREELT